ncbi:hypothetical protein NDU88_003398 [Pleurodeles waltl]|uniref:Uncharacterized protein n=1 Tax=Pleurodeles waltl TaxID=8319 RepID=A0AAV7RF01_PLEWA|nr:hypothetical protein NDU88_003398 [Pleurodeles waltl]
MQQNRRVKGEQKTYLMWRPGGSIAVFCVRTLVASNVRAAAQQVRSSKDSPPGEQGQNQHKLHGRQDDTEAR